MPATTVAEAAAPPIATRTAAGAAVPGVAPEPASSLTAARASGRAALVEATKPRITRMVTITGGVGFVMAALARPWTPGELLVSALGCVAGTALSAAGANALNEWAERRRDALMRRTRSRPIPSGRATPRAVAIAGASASMVGILVLALACGVPAAAVSAATILIYLAVYTPLKPVTPLATLVGAVPGALPPLIGWAAGSSGPLAGWGDGWSALAHPGGWSLFLVMFVWQVPHFLAIAWLHRDDYAAGGFRVLAVVDPTGGRTASASIMWAVCLVPVTLAPARAMPGLLGPAYAAMAVVTGLAFLALVFRFVRGTTPAAARRVFIASVVHLPLILFAMVAEALVRGLL